MTLSSCICMKHFKLIDRKNFAFLATSMQNSDSSTNLNSLVTFPRLQSDSDCRVNFKYHEIITFFRKSAIARTRTSDPLHARLMLYLKTSLPDIPKWPKIIYFVAHTQKPPNCMKFCEIKEKVILHIEIIIS